MRLRCAGLAVALGAIGLLGACQTVGPKSIVKGRPDYNEAIHRTSMQMVLANIVRVSHGQMPLVMDVSQVNASVLVQGTLTPSAMGIGGLSALQGAGPSVTTGTTTTGTSGSLSSRLIGSQTEGLSSGLEYQESPTVTYTPLSGQALISQLANPIPVETIEAIYNADWPLSSVMSFMVDFITPNPRDNAPIENALFELASYQAVGLASFATSNATKVQSGSEQNQPARTSESDPSLTTSRVARPTEPIARPTAGGPGAGSSGNQAVPNLADNNILALYFEPIHPYVKDGYQIDFKNDFGETPGSTSINDYSARRRILNLWMRVLSFYANVVPMQSIYYTCASPLPEHSRCISISKKTDKAVDLRKDGGAALTAKADESKSVVPFAVELGSIKSDLVTCEIWDDREKKDHQCIDQITKSIPHSIYLSQFAQYKNISDSYVQPKLYSDAPILATNSALGALKNSNTISRGRIDPFGTIAFLSPEEYRRVLSAVDSWNKGPCAVSAGIDEFYSFSEENLKLLMDRPSATDCITLKPMAGQYTSDQPGFESADGTASPINTVEDATTSAFIRKENEVFGDRHFILIGEIKRPVGNEIDGDSVAVRQCLNDTCYYILDRDSISKYNFSLVSLIMSVMAVAPATQPPASTIPVR